MSNRQLSCDNRNTRCYTDSVIKQTINLVQNLDYSRNGRNGV